MPWDNSHTKLTGAVNASDIAEAMGTKASARGNMIKYGKGINVLALWKPFQNSAKGFANASDQRAAIRRAGGGFRQYDGQTYNHFPIFNNNASAGESGDEQYMFPHGTWTYYRPNGVDATHNEFFRDQDFAPLGTLDGYQVGYDKKAVSPIYVDWPNLAASGANCMCLVYVGNQAYGPSGGKYNRYFCLSFDDLFPADDSYYDQFHFALLISNIRTHTRNMVVSTTKVSDVTANGAVITFTSLKDCAALQNLQLNDEVQFCICLVQYNGATSSQAIETISGSNNWDVTSLEIALNSDRQLITFPGNGTIAGMSITHNALHLTQVTSPVAGYDAWKICDLGHALEIVSAINSAAQWGSLNGVSGKIKIEVSGSAALLYNASSQYGGMGTIIEIPYTIDLNPSTSPITREYIYGNSIYGMKDGAGINTPFTFYALKQTGSTQICTLKVSVSFTYDTTVSTDPDQHAITY